MTVAVILKHKGSQVETLRPGATLQQTVGVLAAKRIGAAVVVGGQGTYEARCRHCFDPRLGQ